MLPRASRPKTACFLAAFTILALSAAAPAQTIVVAVKSVNALKSDFDYLAALAGPNPQTRAAGEFLKLAAGDRKQTGLEPGRPFGLFFAALPTREADFGSAVAFVPVADEKAFLDFLRSLLFKPQEPDGGIHPVAPPWDPKSRLFIRFAPGTAYIAATPAPLRGRLPDPKAMVPAMGKTDLLVAKLYADRIDPREKKRLIGRFIEPIVQATAGAPAKLPGESEAQHQTRLAQRKSTLEILARPVEETQDVTFLLELDRDKDRLAVDLSLAPRPRSQLAASIQHLGGGRSMFTHLARNAQLSLVSYLPRLGFSREDSVHDLLEGFEQVVDPRKRPLMRRLARTFLSYSTIDASDFGVAFQARDNGVAWVAGLKVRNGRKVEDLLRDFVKDLPAADREAYRIRWNYARHAGIRIHHMRFPLRFGPFDHDGSLYVALRDDAAVASFGLGLGESGGPPSAVPPGLAVLKEALDGLDKPAPAGAPLVKAELSSVWLFAGFLTSLGPDEATAAAWYQMVSSGKIDPATLQKFGDTALVRALNQFRKEDLDRINARLVLTGGETLRLRLEVHTHLFKLAPVIQGLLPK
jgi:hypothetical protein